MTIQNIAGYKFTSLDELPTLCEQMLIKCNELQLKGTVLLSKEGINLNLAGELHLIEAFKSYLKTDARFCDMTFRESVSEFQPFNRMKVKVKKEIITMRSDDVRPEESPRPAILTPAEFKQWLDEGREMTVLDARNEYEVRFGTFRNAVNLKIDDFCEFPTAAAKHIARDKPVVMFCTGGIRCEKAALHLLSEGYSDVYQLEGGILNYFAQVGGAHYEGECFVFDQRVALDSNLQATGTQQCLQCEGPLKLNHCATCNSLSPIN